MDKGYIAITDNNWANFIKENKLSSVNFWCKKQSFKAINKNDIFFFLKKIMMKKKKQNKKEKL